jgi:hypothetical protein
MDYMPKSHSCRDYKLGWVPIFFTTSIFLIVALALSMDKPALAQQTDDILLYSEDFNDNFAEGWDWSGGWGLQTLTDGNIVLAGSQEYEDYIDHYSAIYNGGDWGEEHFTLKFKFKINSGDFYIRFLDRTDVDGNDFYQVGFIPILSRYTLTQLWQIAVNFAKQENSHLDVSISLGNQPISSLDHWYQAEINYAAGHVQIFFDKVEVFETNGAYLPHYFEYADSNPLSSGTIKFLTSEGSSLFIDDVEVWGPPNTYMIMGNVFSSPPGDLSQPIEGVEVSAFVSNNRYPDPGKQLAVTKTDENGRFWFEVPAGFEYYSVREDNFPGYESVAAESPGGEVRENDWIEFSAPLDGKNLDGNRFFDHVQVTEVPTEPIPAYGECPPGIEPSLATHFDQNMPDGWLLDNGWILGNSWLLGEGRDQRVSSSTIYGDLYLNIVFNLPDGKQGIEIVLRDSENGSYRLILYSREWSLERVNRSDPPETVINKIMPLDTFSLRTLVFSAQGKQLRAVLDGLPLFDWSDADPLPPGNLQLNTVQDGAVHIDQLWICGLPVLLPTDKITPTIEPSASETQQIVATITETPTTPTITSTAVIQVDGKDGGMFLIIGGIVFTAVLGWVIFRAARGGGRNRGGSQKSSQVTGPPPLPPIRLVNLWLSQGTSGAGARLGDNLPLKVGGSYTLHLQLSVRGAASQVVSSNQAALFDVVFFASPEQVSLEEPASQIRLEGLGSSPEIRRAIQLLQVGSCQVRACIYYRNVMLQSVTLNAEVTDQEGQPVLEKPAISRQIDYVAAARFHRLDQLPHPMLNIFVNQAPDGSHWVGVYSGDATAPDWLRHGDTHTFSGLEMISLSGHMRDQMMAVEGEALYRMGYPLPMDAATLVKRSRDLVNLALEGATLFDDLFISSAFGLPNDRRTSLQEMLKNPGVISVARCRADAESLPWAALYFLHLDIDHRDDITLCADFQNQLASEVWDADRNLQASTDMLDNPLACRNRVNCPLNGNHPDFIVCPFGFLGFMHQIDQPLQQVTPVQPDTVPPELNSPDFEQSCQIWLKQGDTIHLLMGAFPGFNDAPDHFQELENLFPGGGLDAAYETERDRVKMMIEQGGRHVFYLYCHGLVDNMVFKLKLGPPGGTNTLSAASLDPSKFQRPDQPHALVVLNACDSAAYSPKLVYGFLGKLRLLGAAGVIGSEVKLYTGFARPFGLQLMRDMLSGHSLGQTFLDTRRHFLRQGNPLGLIYSLYAPVNLHLHQELGCTYCSSHQAGED